MTRRPEENRTWNVAALALFAAIAVAMGIDMLEDLAEGTRAMHVVTEGAIVVLALVGFAAFAHRLRQIAQSLRNEADVLRGQTLELAADLAKRQAEAERWRTEAQHALEGLGAAIDRQFERWRLSAAEKEVGLLLLKGLSHREVADVREVSERTVRQQARAVYRKAGLSGRADLAAYFLEDLLLPNASGKNLSASQSEPHPEPDRSDEEPGDRRT